jgi:hypothetical protein
MPESRPRVARRVKCRTILSAAYNGFVVVFVREAILFCAGSDPVRLT